MNGIVAGSAIAASLFAAAAIGDEGSVWDGVYTEAQALRGQAIYAGPCGRCHGARLDGAADDPDMFATPPIGGWKFLRNWNGRSLAALFEYTRTTMPANNPGFLTDGEFADIVAYMLDVSGLPAGDTELEPDQPGLADIRIEPRPCADERCVDDEY